MKHGVGKNVPLVLKIVQLLFTVERLNLTMVVLVRRLLVAFLVQCLIQKQPKILQFTN